MAYLIYWQCERSMGKLVGGATNVVYRLDAT